MTIKDIYVNAKHKFDNGEITLEEFNKIVDVEVPIWTSCKERNPDKDGEYWVTREIYFVPDHVDDANHYKGIERRGYSVKYGWYGSDIYAWMPIPKPWEN